MDGIGGNPLWRCISGAGPVVLVLGSCLKDSSFSLSFARTRVSRFVVTVRVVVRVVVVVCCPLSPTHCAHTPSESFTRARFSSSSLLSCSYFREIHISNQLKLFLLCLINLIHNINREGKKGEPYFLSWAALRSSRALALKTIICWMSVWKWRDCRFGRPAPATAQENFHNRSTSSSRTLMPHLKLVNDSFY